MIEVRPGLMRWLVLLLVMVAFAGCTDAPDAGADSVDDADDTFQDPTPVCDDDGSCTVASFDASRAYTCDDPELECTFDTEIVETPVEWTGHTKEGVWVLCGGPTASTPLPVPAPGCVGQQIQPDGAFQTVIQFDWELTGVDLTLEWTQADATQTGLALNIVDNKDGTNLGTWEDSRTFTVKQDLSVSSYNEAEYDENQLLFQVWPVAKDGGGTFVDVTQQEFTLTGNILSAKPIVVSVEWVGSES